MAPPAASGRSLRRPKAAHGVQHRTRYLPDRAVGGERDAVGAPVRVLDQGLVGPQIEHDDKRSGAVGRRQQTRFPPSRREPQRRVLKLRLRRSQRHRELAEDLGVRVQRVAGRAPPLIRHGRPLAGHQVTLPSQ
jgi:hypothetical protein